MNILLIDNAGLISKNGRFFCVEGTGSFAAELVYLGASVTMYGQKVEMESSVSVYDIEANGIKTAGLWRKNNKLWNYLCLYLNAIKYVLKADFVYIFYPNSFRFLAFICMLFGKRYGLYIRGEEGIEDSVSKKIYRHASVVLTVSPMFTNMVNSVAGRNLAETIRPMLSYDDSFIIRNRVYKEKCGYELLILCRLQREKGIIELLKALKQMRDGGIDRLHLTIVGNGDFVETAREESRVLGLDHIVSFTGGIYDDDLKAEFYKKADLYILPTYNEGFPRTLYEAMIFGVPIITTFVGGIPALMKDGVNCKRIEPKSVESIVQALTYAINNYEEMGNMAKKAIEDVAKVVDHNRPTHARQLYAKMKDYGK